jgi:cyclohexanecarboxylate-CoA ligase
LIETITQALARQARERPGALSLMDDRVRLTWGEVAAWVDRAAGWLRERGLPRGAPVLGWLPNGAEWYLLRLACEEAGLFWIPVPASQGRRELTSIAERARPAVVVSPGHFRERDYAAETDEICRQLSLRPIRVTVPDDGLLRLDGPLDDGSAALRLDEPAHALPTTGSEGIPKLAIYTLAAACERAHAQARLHGVHSDDIVLALSHGTGPAKPAWLAAPIAGSCVIGVPVFSADTALHLIERERPTVVCGTPAQLMMLAKNLGSIDTASVRIWYTAGAVLPPTLAAELESTTRGIVLSTYGGADFGGWAAAEPDDPPAVRHRTVGKPRGGTEFRIVDHEGRDLAVGETGPLIGRGPCCVSGFLGEQGREQWRDGWFHTGDLASIDAAGNITIVGRLTELIVRGGDKISATEVEATLRTHPAVAQVAVIGIPDPVLGERICACIVPALRTKPIELAALRQHLRDQGLAPYKAPEQIVILDTLPVVGDKIDRRALAAAAAHAQ